MKAWVKSHLPKSTLRHLSEFRQIWFTNYARESYSQEGEDLLLGRFLEGRRTGFFVDVGAHHPKRFSNTYALYRKGWNGINIDANPGSMQLFKRIRPRDINIEAAVYSTHKHLTYHAFNEPALNTFNKTLALERVGGAYRIVEEINIEALPLSEILERHVPAGTKIDLLTVDVEGLDLEVLRSNDWSRYVPEFILVECFDWSTWDQAAADPIAQFLMERHYSIVGKTMHTVLFKLMASQQRRSSK